MDMSIVKHANSEWPYNKSVACPLPSVEDAGVAPARRLVEVGIRSIFSVHGDFNITLLVEPGFNLSGCCNELNAGYTADGCAVTVTVRGLGVTIAISGAYSENLPVTCSVGGPNSSDYGTNGIAISGSYSENLPVTCSVGSPNSSDHTIGLPGFSLEYRRFQTVTWIQVIVNHLDDAHKLTDYGISITLMESEHVYISISCNLAAVQHPTFSRQNVPYSLSPSEASVGKWTKDESCLRQNVRLWN